MASKSSHLPVYNDILYGYHTKFETLKQNKYHHYY